MKKQTSKKVTLSVDSLNNAQSLFVSLRGFKSNSIPVPCVPAEKNLKNTDESSKEHGRILAQLAELHHLITEHAKAGIKVCQKVS